MANEAGDDSVRVVVVDEDARTLRVVDASDAFLDRVVQHIMGDVVEEDHRRIRSLSALYSRNRMLGRLASLPPPPLIERFIDRMHRDAVLQARDDHALERAIEESKRQLMLDRRKISEEDLEKMPSATLAEDAAAICTVCQFDMIKGEKERRLPCEHAFHSACVDRWLTACNGCCPTCMAPVRAEKERLDSKST